MQLLRGKLVAVNQFIKHYGKVGIQRCDLNNGRSGDFYFYGCKIPDRFYSACHYFFRNALGFFYRYCKDTNLHSLLGTILLNIFDMMDVISINFVSNQLRI